VRLVLDQTLNLQEELEIAEMEVVHFVVELLTMQTVVHHFVVDPK
jgi:hypothetical protein